MKLSELNVFNRNTKHLQVPNRFNEEYSFGQEWGDVPFEGVDIIRIVTTRTLVGNKNTIEPTIVRMEKKDDHRKYLMFSKYLTYQPTWMDILMKLDDLITESGDHHNITLLHIHRHGNNLQVCLG